MTFEDYLKEKKIDSAKFRSAEPEKWGEWEHRFAQMSHASFTSQKLYLINAIRRKYLLQPATDASPETERQPAAQKKPVFKPKMN